MSLHVLDASVAAKWFLPANTEDLISEAFNVLSDYRGRRISLIAPDLFWPELGNILWKAVRQQRISVQAANLAIADLEISGIQPIPSAPMLRRALAIATTYTRTVYDAIYVALAEATNSPLLTADERLANALAGRFPIRWLGAYVSA